MSKNKIHLIRIVAAAVLYAGAIAVWKFAGLPNYANLIIFLAVYAVIAYDVVWKAAVNISHGQVFDENFLMLIATAGAFVIGEYVEAVAVMLFYQVGELFQNYAVGKSRNSISSLMDIRPDKARVLRGGEEVAVAPEEVEIGEIIVVKAGERIALDGVVVSGESFLDTSALTGESVPRSCKAGDAVLSGSVNTAGVLRIRCENISTIPPSAGYSTLWKTWRVKRRRRKILSPNSQNTIRPSWWDWRRCFSSCPRS